VKTLRLLFTVTAAVLIAGRASAELIIYKGTLKQSGLGQGVSQKLTSKLYLIVDHDTASVAQIEYTSVKGSKAYATGTTTNLQFDQVSAPKGKVTEAIVQPPSSCDTNDGNTSDIVIVKGADSTLAVNTNSTITFPKVLSGSDAEIDHSAGPAIYVASSVVVSFDAADTHLSNQNGETLDAAVSRISAVLEGEGYIKQNAETRKGWVKWTPSSW
jgi:hypothetical protein